MAFRNLTVFATLTALMVGFMLASMTMAHAAERDEDCLTQLIYAEAGGEKPAGKLAVGNVAMNRLKSGAHGKTICAVVYETTVTVEPSGETHIVCQFTFVCAQRPTPNVLSDALLASGYIAQALIEDRIRSDNTDGALYYRRVDNRHPWFEDMVRLGKLVQSARIGAHAFFKLTAGHTTRVKVGWDW